MREAQAFGSWGLPGPFRHEVVDLGSPSADWRRSGARVLAYGNGRSYGDSCINDGGDLLLTRRLNHYCRFDEQTGQLECEAGVQLAEIIRDLLPRGWFPPVTPGTRFVTVGGAIANDVHGKNHHVAGSFGEHVESLVLDRSEEGRVFCSRTENPELFSATIGGLGLTGLITAATLRLRQVESGWINVRQQRFGSLDEFFSINDEAERRFEYTVSWIDCSASPARLGRGIYLAGNHASSADPGSTRRFPGAPTAGNVPFTPPVALVNRVSAKLFNEFYWRRAPEKREFQQSLYPFFYPLDRLSGWNRLYGRDGLFQYQCVLADDAKTATRELLSEIARSNSESFLGVLKTFGDRPRVGKLSFPRAGVTVALDFPNRGSETLALFDRLDRIVESAKGAIYPAKDARMSRRMFESGYPEADEFVRWKDRRFSSSFWKRVREAT